MGLTTMLNSWSLRTDPWATPEVSGTLRDNVLFHPPSQPDACPAEMIQTIRVPVPQKDAVIYDIKCCTEV